MPERPSPPKPASHAPICPGLPLVGNARQLLTNPTGLLVAAQRRLGDLFRLRAAGKTIHVIAGEGAKAFMAEGLDEQHLDRHALFDPLEREFGPADFVMGHTGPRHTRLRAPLAIAYSRHVTAPFIGALIDDVRGEVRRWPIGSTVGVMDQTSRLALAQWRRLLGPGAERLDHRDCRRLSSYWMMVGAAVLPPLIFHAPWYRASHRRTFGTFRDLVREARRGGSPPGTPPTVVQALASAADHTGVPLTDDEVVTYLAYGTLGACAYVARLTAFMLYEIVRDPALMEELRVEIAQAFAAGLRDAADIRRMRILQSVYQETLRLHPVSPGMPFVVRSEFDFRGRHFPAGAFALITPVPLSFDVAAFHEPERFDAARCREPRNEHRKGRCHPFGLGNRTCVAGGLVEVTAITMIAALLHERQVTLDPPGYTLRRTVRPLPAPDRRFALRVGDAPVAAGMAVQPLAPLEEERVAAFTGHDAPGVRAALGRAVVRRYDAGVAIIHEGDAADAYYLLQSGTAIVTVAGADGPVAEIEAGGGFGEAGLLQNAPRNATVSAGPAGAETLVLDRESFLAMVSSSDLVAGEIRSLMQKRIASNRLRAVAPGLTASAVARVLSDFTRHSLPAGHVVLREGEPADQFFVLLEGEVWVSRRDAGGADIQVAVLGPGEYFGEVGLLTGAPRNATVTVSQAGPAEVLRTERSGFDRLLNGTGALGADLSRTMLACAERLAGR